MKLNQNNKGFSLIELMVVVAIIGILASVAVPNMQRFMAKARQSEVKGQLGSIYSAEQNHHGEWSFYRGTLMDIGYAPEGDMRYYVGFGAVGGPAALPANYSPNPVACTSTMVAACTPRATPHPALVAAIGTQAAQGTFANTNVAGGCVVGANPNGLFGNNAAFVATGLGEVGGNGTNQATADIWTMTSNRVLCNNLPNIE